MVGTVWIILRIWLFRRRFGILLSLRFFVLITFNSLNSIGVIWIIWALGGRSCLYVFRFLLVWFMLIFSSIFHMRFSSLVFLSRFLDNLSFTIFLINRLMISLLFSALFAFLYAFKPWKVFFRGQFFFYFKFSSHTFVIIMVVITTASCESVKSSILLGLEERTIACHFFLSWTKVVWNQCNIVDCGVLELSGRWIPYAWCMRMSSSTDSSWWPLTGSCRDVTLIGKVWLSSKIVNGALTWLELTSFFPFRNIRLRLSDATLTLRLHNVRLHWRLLLWSLPWMRVIEWRCSYWINM